VSDEQLDEALQSSDFAINLRLPTMGEASASRLLDQSLVSTIASMCENESDMRLFRNALEIAGATCPL
jgi:hypothetical protein